MVNRTFLALDLEYNQPSGTIIQVGICLGSRLQSEEEYTVKNWLVHTTEPVSPEIVSLTGITDQDIAARGVPVSAVAEELASLLDQRDDLFVNPVTWGGGDAPDLLHLIRQHVEAFPYFGRRWIDVKTMHTLIALGKDKNPAGGLRSVMGQYGLQFRGVPHRADVDAFNTLRLFFRLLERQSSQEAMLLLARGSM